jgi:uncharacterized LabA/DUF88 family protein
MPEEPRVKRAIAFVDGQNLYHAARHQFRSRLPDYDARALAKAVCNRHGWHLTATRFYTGVHKIQKNILWHLFWHKKFSVMERDKDVTIISRELMYVNERVGAPKDDINSPIPVNAEKRMIAMEKGIDLCLALDAIRFARLGALDVVLIFSQDSDFCEVAREIRAMSIEQNRWIKVVSAYPQAKGMKARGIDQTQWIPIDLEMYRSCLDVRDYWGAAHKERGHYENIIADQRKAPAR